MLTPPTGVPALPEFGATIPAQRADGDLRPSAPTPAVVDPCTCGHARAAHDHYRPGHDCGACGAEACGAYRPEGGALRRMLRRLGLAD